MTGEPLRSLTAREFPAAGEGVFFNAASYGLLPRRTVEAVQQLTEARTRPAGFDESDLVDALDRARRAAARLVSAAPGEITLAPNTSYGVNLAARLVGAGPPGTIVVSDREFPANVLPWLPLEEEGFRVERIPADGLGRPDEDRLRARIAEEDVRAFALSAVQFGSGHRADLQAFGDLCRSRDVLFCVDAIQALGAVPVDVEAARIDVLASGGQKWLCSPWGSGFTYVRSDLRERLDPPMVSWLSMADSVDYDRLLDYRYAFFPDGRKFELATLGIQDYLGMAHSVELLLEVGIETIRRHLLEVHRPLVEWIADAEAAVPVTPLEPERRAGIFAFRLPRPERRAAGLEAAGFRLSVREGAIRLAPHLYNTVEEMERLVGLLDRQG